MKKISLLVLCLSICLCFFAKPRTAEMMRQLAAEALNTHSFNATKQNKPLLLLDQKDGLVVYGYEKSGFAVIAEDDMYPAVLGQSDTPYCPNTANENFKWWLRAMQNVVSMHRDTPLKAIKPDPDKHKDSVQPIISTRWGQEDPYSMFVPSGCPTGCVATATAQVLRYNEWPDKGVGEPFTYYPFGDFDGRCLKEDIGLKNYVYEDMLDEYGWGGGTNKQKKAVATLMYHVGLSMKAQYETDGTGSYNESMCYGLRNHLKYPLAVTIDRADYTDEEWMDIIFTMLSNGQPIIYGGSDETYTGHEFVLHGYNKNGRIYINWGWDGSEDGYYDLSLLKVFWGIYDFSYFQDLILRCDPRQIECEQISICLNEPGTLYDNLTEWQRDSVVSLAVSGPLNSTDFRLLRQMAGMDAEGHGTYGHLSFLDLSEATIVSGGEPYLIEGDNEYVTKDDEMPYKVFNNCRFLVDVSLPSNLKTYSDGVFSGCNNLDKVSIGAGPESDFFISGSFVMSGDSTELIEALPTNNVHYIVPAGTKKIHDFAFAGRYLYERLSLPASVETIGCYAFNRCFDLRRTYIYAENPPQIDDTSVDALDLSLRELYVPKGCRSMYRNTDVWKLYGQRIKEFDATDGIKDIISTVHRSKGIFTLDGKRVEHGNLVKPGTYIIDGKKIQFR